MKQLESSPSGEELKKIRRIYKLSRLQMGELLGLSANTVTLYENRKIPVPRKHLKQINQLLSSEPPVSLTTDGLRFLRTSHGLTQKQVAEAFGVNKITISSYERGLASIPDGLPDCIKELAETKAALLLSEQNTPRELMQRIDESRSQEHEQWLRLADQIEPVELRKLRLSRGLSEKNLSEMLGISKTILHLYEHGRRMLPKGLVQKILELCPDRTATPKEITDLRHALGLKQSETGAAVGLTRNAIGYYEAGKRKTNYDVSKKIMDFYREQVEKTAPETSK